MPLNGYRSLCNERQKLIVSKDKKNPQSHRGINADGNVVTQYQIDGVVISVGSRCDFLLMNEDKHTAYLIELKGSDIVKAAEQLDSTENFLRNELAAYEVYYRIVANKCLTHEIRSSSYRKYQIKWGNRLVQKTRCIEENI